ncbi:Reverse transcriptase (RNA-dependent DNA polymerase) [Popillia japonica]|uniref:Reverse transcriptase (RNA-dependent DNA polymerase) n=1 Tax=Popillia japonica TaxID=7064 RepID=A0AAW1KJB4_POPJA
MTQKRLDDLMEREMAGNNAGNISLQGETINNLLKSITDMMQTLNAAKEEKSQVEPNRQYTPDSKEEKSQVEPNRQYTPDLVKNIKIFHADRDVDNAIDWLESIDLNAELFGWDDSMKLATARAHLGGTALNWYATHRRDIQSKSWSEIEHRKGIKAAICVKDYAVEEDILRDLIVLERNRTQKRNYYKSDTKREEGSDWKGVSDKRPPSRKDKSEPKCFNCHEYGHLARTIKKYLKDVMLNGNYKCVGLFDPGSAVCAITASVALKAGLDVRKPAGLELVGFGHVNTNWVNLINEYSDIFAFSLDELGCTDVAKMDIEEHPGSNPVVVCRPYRASARERQLIQEQVDEWRRVGIVEETKSPYASPVLLVPKKTGEARLVVDYRKLNSQTRREHYPLPNLDDHLEKMGRAKLFAALDLASGYLQIQLTEKAKEKTAFITQIQLTEKAKEKTAFITPDCTGQFTRDLASGYLQIQLTEKAKEKTAFITPDCTGQFTRMPYGLTNAPANFQRLMNKVLGPMRNKTTLCYMDDLLKVLGPMRNKTTLCYMDSFGANAK